jgi:hypothetical protein
VRGECWNPYRQNVLKGDYPILGQHTFLNLTATSLTDVEWRQVPTPTSPFESTDDPFQEEFFGNPNQFFLNQDLRLSFDLVHGDAGFKPADWRLKLTPVFNLNYLAVEVGRVAPTSRKNPLPPVSSDRRIVRRNEALGHQPILRLHLAPRGLAAVRE